MVAKVVRNRHMYDLPPTPPPKPFTMYVQVQKIEVLFWYEGSNTSVYWNRRQRVNVGRYTTRDQQIDEQSVNSPSREARDRGIIRKALNTVLRGIASGISRDVGKSKATK